METNEVRPIEPLKFSGMRVDVRPSDTKEGRMIQLEKSLKIFKKKIEKDGVLFEVKERKYYIKPSVLKRAEAKKTKNRKK